MRRIQFIELHEQAWFPGFLRDEVTHTLQFGLILLRAYAPVAGLLQSALNSTSTRSIVDLCSGAGGPWPNLLHRLARPQQPPLHILLTDRYPNAARRQDAAAPEDQIAFYPNPVDAANVPPELKGFRTMFTSFHHFAPEKARAVLQDAVDAGQGIAVFEITKCDASNIALMSLWALMSLAIVPFIRPLRWSRLLWTYVIPVIPLVLLFDGVVSCLRSYTAADLRGIIAKLTGMGYQWQLGDCEAGRCKLSVTYLIGCPEK